MVSPINTIRIFKTKAFARRADGELENSDLCVAVRAAEAGQIDADMGGHVFKQRFARSGQGKSGGFRSVVVYRKGDRAIFAYLFAKKDRANIGPKELKAFKKLAGVMMALDEAGLAKVVANGTIIEVTCDEQAISE